MGGLAGGLLTSIWGGPKRRIAGIAILCSSAALVLLLAALPPSVPLIAGSAAAFLFTSPLTTASLQFIWQPRGAPAGTAPAHTGADAPPLAALQKAGS